MLRNVIVLLMGCCLMALAPLQAEADTSKKFTLGGQAGWPISGEDEDFNKYSAFGKVKLPWTLGPDASVHIVFKWDLTLGALDGEGDSSFIGTTGPSLTIGKSGGLFSVDFGGHIAYLDKYEIGYSNFGGNVQFIAYGGVNLHITDRLFIGYRIDHMSNAKIYDENPSLNLHMVQLGFQF